MRILTGWKETPLGKMLTFQRGFDITKKEQMPGPYDVISSSGPNSTHKEYKVKGPGVVIGRKGSLGTVFLSERDFWPHDTTLWVKDFHGNDVHFAYYFLQTMQLQQYDTGASNPTLNRNHIHSITVKYPEPPIQRRIAAVLSAYDDLIENNTQRIAALEAAAQALYREWFVEFRFPGHESVAWVESELGPIPVGWEWVIVGDLVTSPRDSVQPDEIDSRTPYVGLAHIPQKSIALSQWGEAGETVSTKLVFRKGDILFAKIRPYLHKVAVAPLNGVCSSDTIIIRPRHFDVYGLVLETVFSDEFVSYADKTSQGTNMPRANWDVLEQYPIPLPPNGLVNHFNDLVENSITWIHNAIFRNQRLREARDALLPRLISGELSVEDVPLPEEIDV